MGAGVVCWYVGVVGVGHVVVVGVVVVVVGVVCVRAYFGYARSESLWEDRTISDV